jgi:uncharacterized protein YqeY
MTSKQQLQDDLKDAMRAQDEVRKRTLRLALTSIKIKEVEVGVELTDTDVAAVLQKEAKQRRETLDELDQVDRPDLAAAQQAELEILEAYLPQQLTQEELEELARQAIADANAESPGDMGQVMRILMPQVKGRADGKLVSQVVREQLNK